MEKKAPSYFAPVSFGAGGCWGAGPTPIEALWNACREVKAFARPLGGLKKGVTLTVNVYQIRPGCYAYQDERGVFEVDRETDEIVAYAKVAFRYEEVDPNRPDCRRLGKAGDAYHGGATTIALIDEYNAEGRAPIGEKVA